jgi:tetratricopeptide (TPR) repeat protein
MKASNRHGVDLLSEVATLHAKADTLSDNERFEDAVDVYGDIVDRFAGTPDHAIQTHVCQALVSKGDILGYELGRYNEAIHYFDVAVERFGDNADSTMRESVNTAIVEKAGMLARQGDHKRAITVYDEVIERLEADGLVNYDLFSALNGKALSLYELHDYDAAIAICEMAEQQLSDCPASLQPVGRALRSTHANFLCGRGRFQEALALYAPGTVPDVPENDLNDSTITGDLRVRVTAGRQLGHDEDADAARTELVARFGSHPDRVVRLDVAAALRNDAFALESSSIDGAAAVNEELWHLFGTDADPLIQQIALDGMRRRALLLHRDPLHRLQTLFRRNKAGGTSDDA